MGRRSYTSNRGMSLVEATIILLVLMLVTSVLAPSIYGYVVDARQVKVKEDCEAIGISVARLVRDVGPYLKFNGAGDSVPANHVQVLYSAGNIPAEWGGADPAFADSMDDQLATNAAGYARPGWRGAYLSPSIGADPWGTAYAVNVGYLQPDDPNDCMIDTFCISAGPNKHYDTSMDGNGSGGVNKIGDDFTFIIAGGTCGLDCPNGNCGGGNNGGGGTGTGTGHTIGYWKNHPSAMPNPLYIWLGTPGGTNSIRVDNTTLATSLLSQHNSYGSPSNGIVKLYAQLLAAQLNISSGAGNATIQSTIDAANSWLASHASTSWSTLTGAEQSQVLLWQSALDSYNNGLDHQ